MKQKITIGIGKVSNSYILCDSHIEDYLQEVAQRGYSTLSISTVESEDDVCKICQERMHAREDWIKQ
jgi:hypothetical protein